MISVQQSILNPQPQLVNNQNKINMSQQSFVLVPPQPPILFPNILISNPPLLIYKGLCICFCLNPTTRQIAKHLCLALCNPFIFCALLFFLLYIPYYLKTKKNVHVFICTFLNFFSCCILWQTRN